MSGVAALWRLLVDAAPIWDLVEVPAASVVSGDLPITTPVPALGVSEVSALERTTVSMKEVARLQVERVQVTIHAATYLQQKQLVRLVAAACRNRKALVGDVDVLSILPAGEGPDGFVPDPVIYQQTIDFMVAWRS